MSKIKASHDLCQHFFPRPIFTMTLGSQRLQRNISAGRIAFLLSWNLATECCSFTPWGSESWRTQSTSSTLHIACPCKLRSLGVDNAGGLFLDGFGRFRRCSQICQQTKDWFIPRKLLKRKALQNVVSEIRGYCVNCMCHFFVELGDLPLATHLGFAAWATNCTELWHSLSWREREETTGHDDKGCHRYPESAVLSWLSLFKWSETPKYPTFCCFYSIVYNIPMGWWFTPFLGMKSGERQGIAGAAMA